MFLFRLSNSMKLNLYFMTRIVLTLNFIALNIHTTTILYARYISECFSVIFERIKTYSVTFLNREKAFFMVHALKVFNTI